MTCKTLSKTDQANFSGELHTCPLHDHWSSFQLVDEFGDGLPYAGLLFELMDYEGTIHTGQLDRTGFGKVDRYYCGPATLRLNQSYADENDDYRTLIGRKYYPLPITELQVRAEQTRFFNTTGARTSSNPAQESASVFYQVEVSELVEHIAHLPPLVSRAFPPDKYVHALFRQPAETAVGNHEQVNHVSAHILNGDTPATQRGAAPSPPTARGIALLPNRHYVLEVRPLRALRPMLSTADEFCALNMYQLALMATLSYTDFSQNPATHPVETETVSFPTQPSSGNWFGHALAQFDELWQVDAAQHEGKAYYPLYEEVPYSKRLEVVPFDQQLYPDVNDPNLGRAQENPANLHWFDDRNINEDTDTQAFITHHDELILISVRGTSEVLPDGLRDADARQVLFDEGVGNVHNGFYEAARVVAKFVFEYLKRFHSGQKLVITGHSLGGAIALILAEILRRDDRFELDILLYTYGAPRAGDATFVESASALVHHRIVNHNDPVPSLPAPWMYFSMARIAKGFEVLPLSTAIGTLFLITGNTNLTGESYTHHGKLRHFMAVDLGLVGQSSILWEPGCRTITDRGCARVLQEIDGLPVRGSFWQQLLDNANHSMTGSYIPNCWATLRRWQKAREDNLKRITDSEFDRVSGALNSVIRQLNTLKAESGPRLRGDVQVKNTQISKLDREIRKLYMTQTRLRTLLEKTITQADVYGQFASQPELLAQVLLRWREHLENLAPAPLAMIPQSAADDDAAIASIVGGYVPGQPYSFDIESL